MKGEHSIVKFGDTSIRMAAVGREAASCQLVHLGRFGDIDGVVQTTLFLCSADARYITGRVLNVNGGFHM